MSTEPRRRRAETAQDTTERLLAVARRAFAEQGFAATSLDALAAEAGVTRGALHHHFGNKTGLFEAVLRAVDAEVTDILAAEWAAEPDHWHAFLRWYDHYLAEALHPSRRRILFQDAAAVLGSSKAAAILLDGGTTALIADLRDLIASGLVRQVDPEATAHLLNGAIANLAFWAAEGDPAENRLARARGTLATLLGGLAAR